MPKAALSLDLWALKSVWESRLRRDHAASRRYMVSMNVRQRPLFASNREFSNRVVISHDTNFS